MDTDKPWMRPIQYDEVHTEEASDVRLESDQEPDEGLLNAPERVRDDLSAVKPRGGLSTDNSPMVYRRANPSRNLIDLDDDDEQSEPASADSDDDVEYF